MLTPQYSSTSAGMIVNAVPYVSGNRAQKWVLEMVSSLADKLILYDGDTGIYVTANTKPVRLVEPGQTRNLSQMGLETAFSSVSTIDQAVTWTSSNPAVATVSSTGAVTGVGWGKTYITGTRIQNGVSSTCGYWVYCVDYVMQLNVKYDQGYSTRYTDATSRINTQLTALQDKYISTFGLFVDYSPPASFESLADECTIEDIDSRCTHGSCQSSWRNKDSGNITLYEYHHKNIDNIIFHYVNEMEPIDSGTASMLFIGHVTCCIDDYGFHNTTTLGMTYPISKVASVYNFDSQADELRTVVHEFGHLFDAPDHYGNGTTDEGFSSNCIYGEKKETPNVTSGLTICDGCKAIIEASIAEYFSEG